MESANSLLIAIDAGHGGSDNGAAYQGRLEKNDNLALAKILRENLKDYGINVLMTRESDISVSLRDRTRIANEADADFFISLHRSSSEEAGLGNGVENVIYLTAPKDSTEHAARLILEEVVAVGVQHNRGVRRGSYHVLRKTTMPAIFLELGFTDDSVDNQLFDEKHTQYAAAIANGIRKYFGLPIHESVPAAQVPIAASFPTLPHPPQIDAMPILPEIPKSTQPDISTYAENRTQEIGDERIVEAQRALISKYGFQLTVSGRRDQETKRAAVKALQSEINLEYGKNLITDGVFDDATRTAVRTITPNSSAGMIFILQILLMLNGYDVGVIDAINSTGTRIAVQLFQRDHYMVPSGLVEPEMLVKLLQWG